MLVQARSQQAVARHRERSLQVGRAGSLRHGHTAWLQAAAGSQAVSSYGGARLQGGATNGSIQRWSMAQWLESKASIDVPAPLEACWVMWDDRERIPTWMPWIKSVKVQEGNPALSKWTLSTHQFGRDWEFSWLARNLAPIKGQKIHWVSEPGSASLPGVEIANRGQIRFFRKGPKVTNITLTISYELPSVLVPFANALNPVVEGIIAKDMERFRDMATAKQQAPTKA
uniref:Coenzyme Q-binding protein COQ10 START domain-containing protein n=1 Tax=Chlamydomonas leiostraca TaxID=1034604 RepID=A0A7S0S002_9CHLO|mmetsp:Transcript_37029/g.93380  ORF Transcript_37029/g.93380 Transcript_37029/m.93380 type:complete len:228 (+) Transcript_37029:132-815(+)